MNIKNEDILFLGVITSIFLYVFKDDVNVFFSSRYVKAVRSLGNLSTSQVDSINQILKAWRKYGDGDKYKLAYILGTAWHESKILPVRECFKKTDAEARICVSSRSYGSPVGGHVYYGRGFVQLTWKSNYEKMSTVTNVDLVNNPDLTLKPRIAAEILVYGMMNGSFTGKRLSDYINKSSSNFYNARRIVNGTDKAQLIANYANQILKALQL